MRMVEKRNAPLMTSFRQAEKYGCPIPESTLRRMYRDGTLPTRTIKIGSRVLMNLDLLIDNLNKMEGR